MCHNNDVYVHYPPPYGPVHALHGYGWREFRDDAFFALGVVMATLAVLLLFALIIGLYGEYKHGKG